MQWAMSVVYKHNDSVIDPDCPYCKTSLTIKIDQSKLKQKIENTIEGMDNGPRQIEQLLQE